MEIRQEIKRRAADIEARIAPFLPQEKGFQQTVLDAMEYSDFCRRKASAADADGSILPDV